MRIEYYIDEQPKIDTMVAAGLVSENSRLFQQVREPVHIIGTPDWDKHTTIAHYKMENGVLVLTKDVLEHERPATPEELAEWGACLTKETLIDYFMNPHEDCPPRIWQFYDNALMNMYSNVSQDMGAWEATDQTAMRVWIEEGEDVNDVAAQVRDWLPHIKPFDTLEDGRMGKPLSLMEYTLSEYESWVLVDYGDSVELQSRTYSWHFQESFATWEDALEYCQREHPRTKDLDPDDWEY